MDQKRHDAIAKWERRWLALSGFLSLLFVLLIAFSLATEGGHVAQRSGRASPETLASSQLFAEPGVRALAPGAFQVGLVAQTYNFTPAEIMVPVGSEVEFYATARDVIHGYQVQDTTINVHLIPGEIARFRYTFDRLGEYRVACNEYCGIQHQNMMGKVLVVSASEYAAAQAARDLAAQAPETPFAAGEAVYGANCASCHQVSGQGLPGAFPPLAGHAPDLYGADRSYPIAALLYGLQGAITVAGAGYNGVMPSWQQLGDEDLADVLNYVMNAWGNDALLPDEFGPYTPDEVAAARGRALNSQDVHGLRQGLGLE